MNQGEDKHLPASQRKLDRARTQGQVARSRDLGHLAILATALILLASLAPMVVQWLITGMTRQFQFGPGLVTSTGHMAETLTYWTLAAVGWLMVIAVPVATAAIVSNLGVGGWVFSLTPLKPDFQRLDPLSGFARLLSGSHLAASLKLLPVLAALVLAGITFLWTQTDLLANLRQPFSLASLSLLCDWMFQGCLYLAPVLLIMVLSDIPLQHWMHLRHMRMSHQEMKEEHKESEGNPQARQRLRRRQRDIVQQQSVRQVPKADVVVLNPTHYAVALRYDDARMSVPRVVAKGCDLVALRIREVAMTHQIPVLQAPPLARALYAHADIGDEIPAALYTAVAQVLAYVYQLRAALAGHAPMPSTPNPQVDPLLDPQHTRSVA